MLAHYLLLSFPLFATALPQAATNVKRDTDLNISTLLKQPDCPSDASEEMKTLTRLLPKVLDNAVSSSEKSWELGALTQSLLEVYHPQFAPFEWSYSAFDGKRIPWKVMGITKKALNGYDWNGSPGSNSEGKLEDYITSSPPSKLENRTLIDGAGSLGDPCSLGPAVWMLAKVSGRDDVVDKGYKRPQEYAWAVGNQYLHLDTPVNYGPSWLGRTDTISMRESNENFSIWSDVGYMIPPFIAHLGLVTNRSDLLYKGLEQHRLQGGLIINEDAKMYKHVTDGWDEGFWSTGNGWMTYGLVRVLASVFAAGKQDEFAGEVHEGLYQLSGQFTEMFGPLQPDGLLPNYMKNATRVVSESSGTALIAAAFYRYSVMAAKSSDKYLQDNASGLKEQADTAFKGVVAKVKEDGWLKTVVDPRGEGGFDIVNDTNQSPEGQSFVGMLWAARLAWDEYEKTQSGQEQHKRAVGRRHQ